MIDINTNEEINEVDEIENNCKNFLISNKINFEQMIRCVNYWNYCLDMYKRDELINLYEQGNFKGYGWY